MAGYEAGEASHPKKKKRKKERKLLASFVDMKLRQ
jgi:hypothetical protein